MKSYFLDSSIIVECIRGNRLIQELVINLKGYTSSSYVCLSELFEGVYRGENKQEREKELINFFEGLDEVYGLDEDVAKKFGKIRAGLKTGGNVIEDIDIFIAAICLSKNLTLITLNEKHFSRVSGLKILPAQLLR